MRDFSITAEAVSAGHPDKICDRISDALVDACLAADPASGVIAECALAAGVVFLSVRAGREVPVDAAAIARRAFAEVGYRDGDDGARPTVMLETRVDRGLSDPPDGAHVTSGRMATVFGYAADHTPERMPLPVAAAHRIVKALDAARAGGLLPPLSPDALAQVAVRFEDRRPVALEHVALTVAPEEGEGREIAESVGAVVRTVLADLPVAAGADTRLTVRRAGEAGPAAHSGLTGRKISDDTYGGFCRQGTAGLSGKDPTRIERTGAYAARRAARAVVAARIASEAEVQVSWTGGEERPASLAVDTFGTGRVPDERIARRLAEAFDFRPAAIAEEMGLWQLPARRGGAFFRHLAAYGHMGRTDLDPPWESDDGAAVFS